MSRLRALVGAVLVAGVAACGTTTTTTTSSDAQNTAASDSCAAASDVSMPVASAPAAEQSVAPSTTTIPDELKETLRQQALHSEMAKDALGDGLATAQATDVIPWYADDSLFGYAVMVTLAAPQDVAPSKPVPGIPGPYSNVTSVWITVSPTGEAKGVSVNEGDLSPDVELPIVDPAGLCE